MALSQKTKRKHHYAVYKVYEGTGAYGNGAGTTDVVTRRIHAGDTWAVSEAQACNNVRHRTGGGLAFKVFDDCRDEGEATCYYEAEEIKE